MNRPLAKLGIFTQDSEMLCVNCRLEKDRTLDNNEEDDDSVPVSPGYDTTVCDRCDCVIQVPEALAKEHRMVLKLRVHNINAKMFQSTTITHGIRVPSEDGGFYLVCFSAGGERAWKLEGYNYLNEPSENKTWSEDEQPDVYMFLATHGALIGKKTIENG